MCNTFRFGDTEKCQSVVYDSESERVKGGVGGIGGGVGGGVGGGGLVYLSYFTSL
jgi:hypothetical protein